MTLPGWFLFFSCCRQHAVFMLYACMHACLPTVSCLPVFPPSLTQNKAQAPACHTSTEVRDRRRRGRFFTLLRKSLYLTPQLPFLRRQRECHARQPATQEAENFRRTGGEPSHFFPFSQPAPTAMPALPCHARAASPMATTSPY